MIILKAPLKDAEISLQTDTQKLFFESESYRKSIDGDLTFSPYDLKKEGEEHSFPLPVSFAWKDDKKSKDGYYYLLLSETEDMKSSLVYVTNRTHLDIYNLKVGTKYFWRIQKNGQLSEVSFFKTCLTLPRCLKIDDISNVRDIGGYSVEKGQIRQGLVYRGGEFELHMHLSPTGASELHRLGIRTELDMRKEAEGSVDKTTAEAIGIKRVYVPSVPYGKVFDGDQRKSVKKFFTQFTNIKNYPIYFHCWGGADRTGTFAFILGAFLGMSLEDLIYEYEFTSLSIWGVRTRNYCEFQKFLSSFMSLYGNTLREKATTFLKNHACLSDTQISNIYSILVENVSDIN